MAEENNADVKLALDEMRLSMEKSISAGDGLDQKVNTILVVAGMIMAVVTTLQISLSPGRSLWFWILLAVAVALFILAVALVLRSSAPHTYKLPIAAEWSVLDSRLFNKPEREVILVLLSGYIEQITHNEELNKSKARLHTASFRILIATIVTMLALTAVP